MLQMVMDSIPQFIFWKDRQSVYLGCNQNFARVAGVGQPANIVGKTDFDLAWKPEEAEFFRTCDRRVMQTDQAEYHIIEPQLQADGKQAWLDTNKVPIHDARGQVIGVLGTYEDITARKLLEEQLQQAQKMEAVGQLAGGIAHDFKNLMTVVRGQAELIALGVDGAELQSRLGAISEAALRTSALADRLLTFARKQVSQAQTFDLNDKLRALTEVLRRAIPENIELVFALEENTPCVHMDVGSFEQVVLNLAFNARDAMPSGGKLRLQSAPCHLDTSHPDWVAELRAGAYARLIVSDTGKGMAPEVRPRAFEPFFTTKPPGKGTGLGLSIVWGAVRQAGGHVAVESREGSGCTFRVYLPDAGARITPVPHPASANTAKPGRPQVVLIAEDEPLVRDVTTTMVRSLGHRVLTAANGEEALKLVNQHPEVSLLITDFVMPIMGGRELIKRVKELRPTMALVCVSGYGGSADDVADMASDGVVFLAKPFSSSELTGAVERAGARFKRPAEP
jgi:two-component system cell cycle sensor histidine kinase/response regulator CckA